VTRPGGSGEAEVAAQAFREYRGHVYRFLLRRTGDHHEADELTQRVFVDATAALRDEQTQPQSMLSWLYVVAERRFVDDVRRRVVARRGMRLLVRPEEAHDLAYGRAVAATLRDLISRLPKDQRDVVTMKILEGRPFTEIAQRVGATEAACKMRLSRAVAQLKNELNERGLGPDG
jgi:RNA polymerase sigma-70 factor (ECF subfamily)